MKLAAIALSLLAIQAGSGVAGAASPDMPAPQDEPRYPLGGMFFIGSPDALVKLKDFAAKKGFALEIVTLPDGSQRVPITSALLSFGGFTDVFKEAQSGRLGKLQFGLVTGPVPAVK
ncbi:MAG TPA: hypothetical protein VH722_21385 [Alphaproteobacteria bacterium]|jgi:hypothetical protein|nr:hypothetical protein [Alphaproteobacteria bacterium]